MDQVLSINRILYQILRNQIAEYSGMFLKKITGITKHN